MSPPSIQADVPPERLLAVLGEVRGYGSGGGQAEARVELQGVTAPDGAVQYTRGFYELWNGLWFS
ncbi:MAG: hypothetical protein QXP27_03935 [Candidatus Methanomethyliaceae archaeon]